MDALVSRNRTVGGVPTSLADLGYADIGLDDGYQACHTGVHDGYHGANGWPLINTSKFPDMAAMVARAHSLNLTAVSDVAGRRPVCVIAVSPRFFTVPRYSQGFYANNCYCADPNWAVINFEGDVNYTLSVGFDGIKVDSCGAQQDVQLWMSLFKQAAAANTTAPRVQIENCHNGAWLPQAPRKPGGPVWCPFDLYRSSLDARVDYVALFGHNLATVFPLAAQNLSYPGCRAYADMLEVGVPPGLHPNEVSLTYNEARSHFAAWAIVSSPLVLGLDVRNSTLVDEYWPIIANTELLSVNAAWVGYSGTRVAASAANASYSPCGWYPSCVLPSWEVLSKPLPNGAAAIMVLHHAVEAPATIQLTWSDIPGLAPCSSSGCSVRDAYAHADLGNFSTGFVVNGLDSHDSVFYIVSP